jgi:hypothetical protein
VEFFRAVRDTNANLPEDRRIRVVLGDTSATSMKVEVALIASEVTDLGRKAVIVFGQGHFPRKPLWYPISDPDWMDYWYSHPYSVSTVAHLEAAGISVFSIFAAPSDPFAAVQPGAASWSTPALAIVKGTKLGLDPFASFAGTDTLLTVPDPDGEGFHQEQVRPDTNRSGLTREQFDAVVLLGPEKDMVSIEPFDSTTED